METSKDPFEAGFNQQGGESPPGSLLAANVTGNQTNAGSLIVNGPDDDYDYGYESDTPNQTKKPSSSRDVPKTVVVRGSTSKEAAREEEEEDEEDNMEVEHGKLASHSDPDKMAKMQMKMDMVCFWMKVVSLFSIIIIETENQEFIWSHEIIFTSFYRVAAGIGAILSQFTEEQMNRYESFRRSGFQRTNMKKLLASVTGSQKISLPITIVVCGIAKMFVGELVECARVVMTERQETGPIRSCHIREAYRRLKLEGKIPAKSTHRLLR